MKSFKIRFSSTPKQSLIRKNNLACVNCQLLIMNLELEHQMKKQASNKIMMFSSLFYKSNDDFQHKSILSHDSMTTMDQNIGWYISNQQYQSRLCHSFQLISVHKHISQFIEHIGRSQPNIYQTIPFQDKTLFSIFFAKEREWREFYAFLIQENLQEREFTLTHHLYLEGFRLR